MKSKILIGRTDFANFPELNLEGIEVKTDTGAYTSSFHCHNIEVISINGQDKLRCFFLDPGHQKYHNKEIIFERFSKRKIRTSNDQMEERYCIKTPIKLFNRTALIELTLTERGNLRFPVLLGRKFLSGRFIVDSAKINLSAKGLKKIIKQDPGSLDTFSVKTRNSQ